MGREAAGNGAACNLVPLAWVRREVAKAGDDGGACACGAVAAATAGVALCGGAVTRGLDGGGAAVGCAGACGEGALVGLLGGGCCGRTGAAMGSGGAGGTQGEAAGAASGSVGSGEQQSQKTGGEKGSLALSSACYARVDIPLAVFGEVPTGGTAWNEAAGSTAGCSRREGVAELLEGGGGWFGGSRRGASGKGGGCAGRRTAFDVEVLWGVDKTGSGAAESGSLADGDGRYESGGGCGVLARGASGDSAA